MQKRIHHFWWWAALLRWDYFRPVILVLDIVACPPAQKLCFRKDNHQEPETVQNRTIVHVPYQIRGYFAGHLIRASREVHWIFWTYGFYITVDDGGILAMKILKSLSYV